VTAFDQRDAATGGAVEIRLERVNQLFDSLDPYPFATRDLAAAAEEFIVGWARELSGRQPITIVVHLPRAELSDQVTRELPAAFSQHFRGRVEQAGRELRELFRIGYVSLAIGLTVFAGCLALGRMLEDRFGDGFLGRFLNEGLILFGWVANWRPLEIFLYDWWPIVRRRNLYRRLAAAKVVLKSF
jgi:hypothetical protein